MNIAITADTTDATILASVEAARDAVARRCSERASVDTINKAVLVLAEAEGEAQARIAYRNALRGGAGDNEAADHLMTLVLCGADDAWSGRANDARRARFDGLRGFAQQVARGF